MLRKVVILRGLGWARVFDGLGQNRIVVDTELSKRGLSDDNAPYRRLAVNSLAMETLYIS
jgi:hypothetical protein